MLEKKRLLPDEGDLQVLVGRRAFADFQLMTNLEQARRSLIIIEHHPALRGRDHFTTN
jgi:hypothetical protein